MNQQSGNSPASQPGPGDRILSPAAERALAEAAARRALAQAAQAAQGDGRTGGEHPREINGRSGLDPARYGDWEVKGIISDF